MQDLENQIKHLLHSALTSHNHRELNSTIITSEGISIDDEMVKLAIKISQDSPTIRSAITNLISTSIKPLISDKKISIYFVGVSVGVSANNTADAGKYRVPNVKNIILVGSGKGGVGKSTVATNLACSLALHAHKVALVDADIYGPSIPIMMGTHDNQLVLEDGEFLPMVGYGVQHLSMGHLTTSDKALVWRGPMLQKALWQLITKVRWSDVDIMVIDLPPGTGDIQLSLSQKLHIDGAILVTTAQKVAVADVTKAADMFTQMGTPILGVIENMSHSHMAHQLDTNRELQSHTPQTPLQQLLEAYHLSILATIPFNLGISTAADMGQPIILTDPVVRTIYDEIVTKVLPQIGIVQ